MSEDKVIVPYKVNLARSIADRAWEATFAEYCALGCIEAVAKEAAETASIEAYERALSN